MSYRHIENLYRNKEILYFKECWALEKIHGTSSHVSYNAKTDSLTFFSGGTKYDQFVALFDQNTLLEKFRVNAKEHAAVNQITIYGEAYGGSVQKMKDTYGPNLKFVAFEVLINANNEEWLSVPNAEKLANKFGMEFVSYTKINTTEEAINVEMMADSVQAVRNGMGSGHMREGVVLRPLIELIHPNGGRIISKHKRPEFAERMNTPSFADPEQLRVLEDANKIAKEWVNTVRLQHVLDGFSEPKIEDSNKVIKAMWEDVSREASGEIVENKEVRKAVGKKTMELFKTYLRG
jgi:hypothetical protein